VVLSTYGRQDVMFRELRRPQGDPEVLAAQSREQYFKVPFCSIWVHGNFVLNDVYSYILNSNYDHFLWCF
jgi:hypothetical protein